MSDVHLGRPFGWLPPAHRETRRRELQEVWRRVVEEAITRRVDALLVPGDLFDGEEADVETVNRAIECVSVRGCPPVFIAPGNHDCYSRVNTYYDNSKLIARGQPAWPAHVTIFTSPELASVPLASEPAVRLWGRCVHANVDSSERILARSSLPRLEPDRANFLLLHGSRDGFLRPGKRLTAPFSDAEILSSGFDYVALGHYHEPSEIRDERGRLRAAYSGAPAPLARDETGVQGALLVQLDIDLASPAIERVRRVDSEAIRVDQRRLLEVRVDLTGCGSREAGAERLRHVLEADGASASDMVIARFSGRPRPGVDVVPRREDVGERVWFLSCDDSALRPDYDLEPYRRGEARTTEERFASSLLAEIESERDPDRREQLEAALYYGLDALKQGQVNPRYEWGLE